jgi:hypothetical protein
MYRPGRRRCWSRWVASCSTGTRRSAYVALESEVVWCAEQSGVWQRSARARLAQQGGAPLCVPCRPVRPLAEMCRRLSCLLLLSEYVPWRWAIPIPPGCALVGGHPVEPLPRATLGAGTQRGMVHSDQVRRRSRHIICCHGRHGPSLGMSGASACLPLRSTLHGASAHQHCWRMPSNNA